MISQVVRKNSCSECREFAAGDPIIPMNIRARVGGLRRRTALFPA
jgi:hypothetical protein